METPYQSDEEYYSESSYYSSDESEYETDEELVFPFQQFRIADETDYESDDYDEEGEIDYDLD